MLNDKQDITGQGNSELSLLVFNTEHLYHMRRNVDSLMSALDNQFVYTLDQLQWLIEDLQRDERERQAE